MAQKENWVVSHRLCRWSTESTRAVALTTTFIVLDVNYLRHQHGQTAVNTTNFPHWWQSGPRLIKFNRASSQKKQQGQSTKTEPFLRADAYKIKGNITKSNTGVYGHTVKIKGMVSSLQKDMIIASSKDLSFVGKKKEEKTWSCIETQTEGKFNLQNKDITQNI